MIATMLIGGLGNQMFQYAAGRALADARKTGLTLDLSSLGRHDPSGAAVRSFELDRFSVRASPAARPEVVQLALARRETRWLGMLSPWRAFREASLDYDPSVLTLADRTYLIGYWQSWRYIEGLEMQLARDFTPTQPLSAASRLVEDRIRRHRSVFVHVRRGDYVSAPTVGAHHGVLGLEYYRSAIDRVRDAVSDARVFLFSDDAAWCRSAFADIPIPHEVVDVNSGADSWQDMILMSRCDHAIIANSSFSWWAAWLGDRTNVENRLVFAPRNWFAGTGVDISDRVPPAWFAI